MVKYKLTAVILLLFVTLKSYGQIDVPDYSFTGKEISDFKVSPSYTAIEFNMSMPSKMDIYLQKRKAEMKIGDKRDYMSEEPGFIYKGQNSANFTSLFVGVKALRNNVVKSFLNDRYIDVVASYTRFEKKLAKSEYANETKFLYGVSLFYTGRHKEAIDVLMSVISSGGEYGELAQDMLFFIADELNRYDIMEEASGIIQDYTPYSLSQWIEYIYSQNRFGEILNLLDNNPVLEADYPSYADVRITCYYFLNRYKDVQKLADKIVDKNITPLVVDSYIMTNDLIKAEKLLKSVPENDTYYLLQAKIDLIKKNYKSAIKNAEKIKNDNEKLALFFYALSNQFDSITPEFIKSFKFNEQANNDYVNYFSGMKYLKDKDYYNALHYFSLISFNKYLLVSSYFYQGMAAANIDMNRAERNFNKYINMGSEEYKLMLSKFMISQMYYLREKYDEALMLIDDCNTGYCQVLKADIYLSLNEEDKALKLIAGRKDDRSRLIRANIFYNNKKYKSSIEEIVKIKNKNADSEYLLMMCLFKQKRVVEAEKLMNKNKDDLRIFSNGIQQLILAGYGKKALAYMDSIKNITPEFKLERAKLLAAYNREKEAKKDYNELIVEGKFIYESIQGLFEIAKKEKKGKDFVEDKLRYIEKSADFENKDKLTAEFADYALTIKAPNTAIGYVNYFMDNYQKSAYLTNVLEIRARLFRFTGRYENCVEDADKIIAKGGEAAESAMFMKGECLENINIKKAVNVYKETAEKSKRFSIPALSKVLSLSSDAEDVFQSAEKLKKESAGLWEKGILRFMDLSSDVDFNRHKDYIYELSENSIPSVSSASIWRIGKYEYDSGKTEESAVIFMKGYYLYPEEKYAELNLKGARSTYVKRQMNNEVKIIDKLIAKYNKNKKEEKNKKNK